MTNQSLIIIGTFQTEGGGQPKSLLHMWNLNILYQERFSATFIYHIFFAIIRLTIRSNNILWTADSKQDNPEKKCHCQMCGNKV